jgi:hypothetical protein
MNEAPPRLAEYQVSLLDWGDEDEAQNISKVIQPIVSVLNDILDLSRWDGLTIAYDYPRALRELDRGDDRLSAPKTADESVGVGMAQTPIILSNGEIKFRTVLRVDVILGITSEDETAYETALHILTNQLAYVDAATKIEKALPNTLLSPLDEYQSNRLFNITYGAIADYLSARTSAGVGASELVNSWNASAVEASLNCYINELPNIIESYQSHHDVGRLLEEVLKAVEPVITTTARYIGHLDGLDREYLESSSIHLMLRSQELEDWSALFASELRSIWKSFGNWSNIKQFTDLNIHVERLVWRHGVFFWPQGDGCFVRVMPPSFDFNSMVKSIPEAFTNSVVDPADLKIFDELKQSPDQSPH